MAQHEDAGVLDALHSSDAFLSTLYGEAVYMRWMAAKMERKCRTETHFITLMLDLVWEKLITPKVDAPAAAASRTSNGDSTHGVKDEDPPVTSADKPNSTEDGDEVGDSPAGAHAPESNKFVCVTCRAKFPGFNQLMAHMDSQHAHDH